MRDVTGLIAVTRFPSIFTSVQRLAKVKGERCTREDFAREVSRYPLDLMRQMENRLAALPQVKRDALLKELLK